MFSKELKKKVSKVGKESLGEVARERIRKKNNYIKSRSRFKSKFRRNNKCFNYNKDRHCVRNCPDCKGKKNF